MGWEKEEKRELNEKVRKRLEQEGEERRVRKGEESWRERERKEMRRLPPILTPEPIFLSNVCPRGRSQSPGPQTDAALPGEPESNKEQVHPERGGFHGSSFWNQGPVDSECKRCGAGQSLG